MSEVSQGDLPDLLPARMVNEYVYCPRLAYLEWVQGEWDDNKDTVEGRFVHRRVDHEPRTEVPEPAEGEAPEGAPEGPPATRSLMLSSEDLGVIARIDVLELDGNRAVPVDYKRGTLPETEHRAHDPERVQVCLQGLILRDSGYACDSGIIYYAESRTRVEVPFDEDLVRLSREAVAGLRSLAESGRLPPPLVDSPKCVRCSLAGICLPDEISRLGAPGWEREVRRLVPAMDNRVPLYVQEQGARVGKRGERLTVRVEGGDDVEVRLMELSQVAVFGNVQVTTQALRTAVESDVPVVFFSQGGWFYGIASGLGHRNVELRMAQHRLADGPGGGTASGPETGDVSGGDPTALQVARSLVAGKIYNQRTLIRRNLEPRDARLVGRLALYVRQARHAREAASLLGIEGMAAKEYFTGFSRLFRGAGGWAGRVFAEGGRNRRPPRDEVNAVLSFLYALLTKECSIAAASVGFDVFRGFYHAPKYGRPALALDLCEEFRPLVADSVCLTLFNQGELVPTSFVRRSRGVALTPPGRRTVLGGYERRLNQEVTHPVFGYTLSYRRVLEIQARLLRAVVLGEVPSYRPFSTR